MFNVLVCEFLTFVLEVVSGLDKEVIRIELAGRYPLNRMCREMQRDESIRRNDTEAARLAPTTGLSGGAASRRRCFDVPATF